MTISHAQISSDEIGLWAAAFAPALPEICDHRLRHHVSAVPCTVLWNMMSDTGGAEVTVSTCTSTSSDAGVNCVLSVMGMSWE